MKTPITPEALFDLGFKDTSSPDDMIFNDYTYFVEKFFINFYGDNICEIKFSDIWVETNATTIEDIKELMRLFK